jgi:hypothetical protein
VPFIFFTAMPELVCLTRWAATPVVSKPAEAKTIIGVVKFVLSPEARDSIVKSQESDHDSAKLARIDQVISEGEQRIALLRPRHCRLANSGADTSVAERPVATTIEVMENLRSRRQMSAHLASKSSRR